MIQRWHVTVSVSKIRFTLLRFGLELVPVSALISFVVGLLVCKILRWDTIVQTEKQLKYLK